MIDEEKEIQRLFEIERAAIRKSAEERAGARDLERASEAKHSGSFAEENDADL